MQDPWIPLVLVLAVAAGLVTATLSASWVHSRPTAFHRWFLANILLFNLLALLGLLAHITREALPAGPGTHPGVWQIILLTAMAPLKLGWLHAFSGMNQALLGRELPRAGLRRKALLGGILLAVYGSLLVLSAARGMAGLLQTVVILFEVLVIGGALASAALLLSEARRLAAPARRRALALFGGSHLLLLGAVGASVGLGWLWDRSHPLFHGLVQVVYNLLPLGWILRYQPQGPEALSEATDPYGLTARERDIIDQVCAGRSNQEIAERLFISLATVKDHNHHIFRKTGVRSRLELANLFRGS